MLPKILNWINDRWPLNAVIRRGLEEEMLGGTSYAYVFGSCVLLIFSLQVVTGVCQLLCFAPTIDRGYGSLNFLRTEPLRSARISDVIATGTPCALRRMGDV